MGTTFDTKASFLKPLLAVMLIVALAIPACMTIQCAAMTGNPHAPAHRGSLTDCLATVTHDGLAGSGGTAAFTALLALVAAALSLLVTPATAALAVARVPHATSHASPPDDLEPLGTRLRI